MQVQNAIQIKNGAKQKHNRLGSITQPLQFISKHDKDTEWAAWNLDWLEWNGLKQLRKNSRRLMKNYKLSKGGRRMSPLNAIHSRKSQSTAAIYGVANTQFSLKCRCGENGPDDLQEALADGWCDIDYDESGSTGEYIGNCPNCR